MATWLRQSTAVTRRIGPFLDETDGKTAETALSIVQADVRLSKNGGAFAQKTEASASIHDENGHYGVALDITDTDTLGTLRLNVSKAGCLPVWQDFMVVMASVYDSMFSTAPAAGDPWAAPLPGAYVEGQAGFILYSLLPIMGAYEGMVRMQTSGPGMNRGNMRKLLRLRLRGTTAESYIAEHFDRQLNLSAQEISLLLAQDRNAQVNYGRSSYSFGTVAGIDEYPLYGIADLHSPRDLYGGSNAAGGRCITEKEKTLLLAKNPSGMDEDGMHLYWVKHVSDETYRLTITATAGTFTLTYNGSSETAALAFDISAADLQLALEGLDGVGDGNVTVTEDDDGIYVITFAGDLSQVNMAEFEADVTSLTGGTAILEQHHYSICFIKTPGSGQTFTFVYNLLVPEIPTGLAGDDLSYSVVPPIHYEAIVHHAAMILAGYSSSPQAQFALAMAGMAGQQAVDSGAKAISPFQIRT